MTRLARSTMFGSEAPQLVPRLFTTAEAAEHLRFKSPSGIRAAVARRQLIPFGRGAKPSRLLTLDERHRFVTARATRYREGDHEVRGERGDVSHEAIWEA